MQHEYNLEINEVRKMNFKFKEKHDYSVAKMNVQSEELGKLRDLLISHQESEKNYLAQIK